MTEATQFNHRLSQCLTCRSPRSSCRSPAPRPSISAISPTRFRAEGAEPNLEGAAQMIEILALLDQKTRGNLTAEERQVLEQVLYELRMRFVEARRHGRIIIERSVSSRPRHARHPSRHRHVARRAGDRLRLRRLPFDRPAGSAHAPVDPDRPQRATATRPRSPIARRRPLRPRRHRHRSSRAGARPTTSGASTRSCSRTATPITFSASTRCAASTSLQQSPIPCYARSSARSAICGGCSRYIFDPPRAPGGGVPQMTLFAIGGRVFARRRRDRAGAAHARPAADPRLPHRAVRLSDRLQPHPRRVVAAARGRPDAGPRRAARSAAPDAFQRRRSARGRRAPRPERTYFTHICHDLPHAATCARLPAGVELAYDGLVLEIA